MSTITRTYSVGDKGRARRLDNLTGPWIAVDPTTNLVIPSAPGLFWDVETDTIDADKVYIVGVMGAGTPNFYGIAVSDDAGVTWNQPYHLTGGDYSTLFSGVGLPFTFWEVSVVDANVIYACGDNGWVVKSTDGGQSFNKCTQLPAVSPYGPADGPAPAPALHPCQALHFITPLIGVVSCYGNIFKTLDGGNTWSQLNGGQPIATGFVTFRGVGFGLFISQDQQTIVCLNSTSGTPSSIVRSTDFGATFTTVHIWPSELTGIHLTWTDDLHLWGFSSKYGRIRSVDGGATWIYLEPPHDFPLPTKNDYAGHFYSNTEGFYAESDIVSQTLDGGILSKIPSETAPYIVRALWTRLASPPQPCYLLTDCEGNQAPFVTNTDLSAYLGQTIETCINTNPPPQKGNIATPPAPTNNTICYNIENCCDSSQITAFPNPTFVPLNVGDIITFPNTHPGICWRITGTAICQMNPIPSDPLLLTWYSEPYTIYTDCALCTAGIGFPCSVPQSLYTVTSCCTQQSLTIGTQNDLSGFEGSVITFGGINIPELGTECWTLSKWIPGQPPASVTVNTAINPITSYPNTGCNDPVCLAACLPTWPDGCYCVTVELAPDCTGSAPWPGEIFATHPDCITCLGICYLLTDCEGILDPITVSNDLSAFVGQTVQFKDCGDTCWTVEIAPNCDDPSCVTEVENSFVDCVSCLPPVLPIPVEELHPRRVKPGYYTLGCDPDYTEKVNCRFAEAVYDHMVKIRYGLTMCCEEDFDQWAIRKQELDLRALYDPELCKPAFTKCCPPCDVTVSLFVFNAISCPAPSTVIPIIDYGQCTIWNVTAPAQSSVDALYRDCNNNLLTVSLAPGESIALCASFVFNISKGVVINTGVAC